MFQRGRRHDISERTPRTLRPLPRRFRVPRRRQRTQLLLALALLASLYVWYTRKLTTLFVSDNVSGLQESFATPPSTARLVDKEAPSKSQSLQASTKVGKNKPSDAQEGTIAANLTRLEPLEESSRQTLGVARFENGTRGYVADPQALRKGVASFLARLGYNESELSRNPQLYWRLLLEYEQEHRNGTFFGNEILSSNYICAAGPGRGYEQDYGYKLLTEKIQISNHTDHHDTKVLCLVYTYPKMRDLLRTQALSWGYKCDGYLAFSTETIPALGLVHLEHEGEESYSNMWQKVRSIWAFVHKHYENDYDFFHLGGDDLYLVVENLRRFLSETNRQTPSVMDPLFLGQWIPHGDTYYVSGGPGYTVNRAALSRLAVDLIPTCEVHKKVSYEDRLVSKCFREIGIVGGDTREFHTGEQLYHDCGPAHLYTFRSTKSRGSFHAKAAAYWETLHHRNSNATVGPKHGLDAAGAYSVSFHDIYHPLYMARLHAILYKETCPTTSPLRRALSAHSN